MNEIISKKMDLLLDGFMHNSNIWMKTSPLHHIHHIQQTFTRFLESTPIHHSRPHRGQENHPFVTIYHCHMLGWKFLQGSLQKAQPSLNPLIESFNTLQFFSPAARATRSHSLLKARRPVGTAKAP